jgi:hypothetical protein
LSSEEWVIGGETAGWGEAVEGVAGDVVADAVVDIASVETTLTTSPSLAVSHTPTLRSSAISTHSVVTAETPVSLLEARLRTAEALGYPYHRDPLPALQHPSEAPSQPQRYDDWLLQKRVRVRKSWAEEDVGDSCCFGTRTVEGGRGWID